MLIVFLMYALAGPVVAEKLVPFMSSAENVDSCVAIEEPSSLPGCNCRPDGVSINEKFSLVYNSLNAPREFFTNLGSRGSTGACQCIKQIGQSKLENSTCTYYTASFDERREDLREELDF